MQDVATHIVIPDTQAKPGVPDVHLAWIGQYVVDEFAHRPNVKIVHLGDHWDMASLSSYDKGKRAMEGRRYVDDVDAGNEAFDTLNAPIADHNRGRRKKWNPRRIFLLGNHEDRITRATETDAQLEGKLSLDDLNAASWGWEVHDYLHPVCVDGVSYAHYFYNPMSGRPYGGNSIDNRIRTIGHSFTQGHQQTLLYGIRYRQDGRAIHGLIAGACYLHDEDYKGPQGNAHWRGIIVCHQVEDGEYDPMFVSLDYLCRRYEGQRLRELAA